MRVADLIRTACASNASPDAKVRMANVLNALEDNLGALSALGVDDDVRSVYAGWRHVVAKLEDDFPYVEKALRAVFALPDVTEAMLDRGSGDGDSDDSGADENGADENGADERLLDAILTSAATTQTWVMVSMTVNAVVTMGALLAVLGALAR